MAPHLDFSPALPLVVRDREQLADGIVGITLVSPHGSALPEWQPGSHITIRLSDALDREYSLCGDTDDHKTWRVAVRVGVEGRGGAAHVDAHLHPGAQVTVTRLANLFPYEPAADPLFIAGGIGITPLIPMMQAAERAGTPWDLVYIGADRSSMAFVTSIEQLGGRVHVVETALSGRPDLGRLLDENRSRHIFCCGPTSMIDQVEAHTLPWSGRHVSMERFAARALPADTVNTAFDVILAASDRRIHVPANKSLLDALVEAGVEIMHSCKVGTCGSCEVEVIDGIPDHRDSNLTPEEQEANEYMYACVSRCLSPCLTLDL